MLWAVVGLPVLLPIVALLQLLFPGILREQWRQYRYAVQTLLTQSTLIFLQWALVRWVFSERPWWLSDDALAAALVVVALVGVARAWSNRRSWVAESKDVIAADTGSHSVRQAGSPDLQASPTSSDVPADTDSVGKPPTSLEYWALGVTLAAGLAWCAYTLYTGGSPWDQMAVVTLAALAGVLHLAYRQLLAIRGGRARLSTELVFVLGLALAGAGVGLYARQTDNNLLAGEVHSHWPTFHGNSRRTGSLTPGDRGPERPIVLWVFEPRERKGRIVIHSSPCAVDGQVYVGAMHQVLGFAEGLLYCVNAADGRQSAAGPVPLGGRLWSFSAEGTLKSVFASPVIVAGRVYIGEGYHQHTDCRLLCLDAQSGDRVLWSRPTSSHVESTPTVEGNRVYFGAGDDGLLCVDTAELSNGEAEYPAPKDVWQVEGVHIDSSPTLTDGRVFAGSVLGDRYQELCVLAVGANSGEVLWKTPIPLPAPSAAATAEGRVYFALGNGKLNADADAPDGRIWCLQADNGQRVWEFRAQNSILGSPAVAGGRVYCTSRDGHCYALDAATGDVAWRRDLGEASVASPIVSGGRVFALTVDGRLFALDAATGDMIWTFDELRNDTADAWSSPALADGRLYVASGGKLYAVGDAQP